MLDQTPFYAESGGQIGDRGYLSGDSVLVRIEDVQQKSGIYIHYGRIERGTLKLATQSPPRLTARAQANHTATHLLQAALKKIVDDSISQAVTRCL